MQRFGSLRRRRLNEIWKHETLDFTPWLAEHINALGDALGMELELQGTEAPVGGFALDLLAKDLGTGSTVVIENQLAKTDHDHLGKLLTYAGGFDANVLIWIADSIRDEHRQALEWLNQHTGPDIYIFGVVVEVLQIDDSQPAYDFRPVVFPNEWKKKPGRRVTPVSPKSEKYQAFFQKLLDELREKHKFTGARKGQPQSWYSFSSGLSGVQYAFSFAQGSKTRTELYIDFGDKDQNKSFFDWIRNELKIQNTMPNLEWERLDDKRACRIAAYKEGSIEDAPESLISLRKWAIENLLEFKKLFGPHIRLYKRKGSLVSIA